MKKKVNKKPNYEFNIHASVVFQLGRDLITDDVQALVELVKNSYDADAVYSNVIVDTKVVLDKESTFPGAKGTISIEDNGVGMNEKKIVNGWLTISNSEKRKMKERGETTKKGRTPLGDKGLGRLGCQRLGNNIEIFTYPKELTHGYKVSFTWKNFANDRLLNEVPVVVKKIEKKKEQGTDIIISDLTDLDVWEDQTSIDGLKKKLSSMISPYKEAKGFNVYVKINNQPLDLASITEKLRDSAFIRYQLVFNSQDGLVISSKVRLAYLKPPNTDKDKQRLFEKYIENKKGKDFFNYISSKKTYPIMLSESDKWFIEAEFRKKWDDFDKLSTIKDPNNKNEKLIADPGPFHGEIDYFHYEEGIEYQNIFDEKSEYKTFLKTLSGIKVYRDGFGIKVDKDWLGLSKLQTEGASFYGLRPHNTLGFISISAKNNSYLKELTNREGFVENPYYKNFYSLLQFFVSKSLNFQTYLRRELNIYLNEKAKEELPIEKPKEAEDIIKYLGKKGKEAELGEKKISESFESLKKLSDTLTEIKTFIPNITEFDKNEKPQKSIEQLKQIGEKINLNLKEINSIISSQSDLTIQAKILETEFSTIKNQLILLYETASLGITTEALSHEINNILDRLNQKTYEIEKYMNSKEITDVKLITFVQDVKSILSTLRKQLSHINPSLRYLREEKQQIDLQEFWEEEEEFYQERLNKNNIKLISHFKNNFIIKLNKGKLIQIIENLFLNSEYWIREDIRLKKMHEGEIHIEIEKPKLRIWDNGRGIEPGIENLIFEPFVTTKEKGRGLGLFIIRQLLDIEGCEIKLLDVKNKKERRYIFELNFEGIIND